MVLRLGLKAKSGKFGSLGGFPGAEVMRDDRGVRGRGGESWGGDGASSAEPFRRGLRNGRAMGSRGREISRFIRREALEN